MLSNLKRIEGNNLIQVGEIEDLKGLEIIRRVYSPYGISPTVSTVGQQRTEDCLHPNRETNKCSMIGKLTGGYYDRYDHIARVYNPIYIAPTLHQMVGGNDKPKIIVIDDE